jgi:hypothetical protein
MTPEELIKELGRTLGAPMELSPVGTCRAAFDGDIIEFEKVDDDLWIMADLGSAQNREDAVSSLLAGNRLGLQTGGATIALDEERSMFTMHMELWGDMPYLSFEAKLTMFIKALRWWKDWLSLPPLKSMVKQVHPVAAPVSGQADGIMEDIYAPLGGMLRV